MMTIPNTKNITTISYNSNLVPTLVSHDDVPGIKEPVSIVKGCVFWRQRLWNNGHILPEYITVFLCVPTQEYTSNPKRIGMGSCANHPNTNGVYIHILGTFSHAEDKDKKLMLPRHRVLWTSYSKYLQEFGWNYLCSIGKYEGASMEDVRQRAYTAIRRHRGPWYLEDATFNTEIETNFGLLKRAVKIFVDDVFKDGTIATNLGERLEQTINVYNNFLWRNLGDESWECMVNHVTSAMKVYFEQEYPPKVDGEYLKSLDIRLKNWLDKARIEVFSEE